MKFYVLMVLYICGLFSQMIVESEGHIKDGSFWIFTDSTNKKIYSTSNSSEQTYYIPVQRIATPFAVHYIEITEKLYWSDVSLKEIRSTSVDGADDMLILSLDNNSIPDGLAVDETYNLLFFSDAGNHLIALLDLNGFIRVDVITKHCDQPRAIVLDSDNGTMYWTDWGMVPKIESANYDGRNRKEIIKARLLWPNALSIDFTDKWIYWGDAGTYNIEKAKLDGSQRQVIFHDPKGHFFSLIVEDGVIFYTDWEHRSVMSIKIDGKDNRPIGKEMFGRLNDLTHLKQKPKNPRINICKKQKESCSHICLPKSNGERLCLCPAGYTLQNNTYCTAAIVCRPINPVGVVVTGCDSPFTVGTLCEQECADGFEKIHGTNARVCKSDGDWSGQEMECKKKSILCPELLLAPSVLLSGCKDPYIVGSICEQDCVAGYRKLQGSSVRVCKPDGTWSGQDLFCHAYIAEQNTNNGVVLAICIAAVAVIMSMLMMACGVLIYISTTSTSATSNRLTNSGRHGPDTADNSQ